MPKWLKCEIAKGMFSDELTIIVQTRTDGKLSFFVPRDTADDWKNRVKVRVTEQDGHAFAVLPDDQQSIIDVDIEALVDA